MSYIAVVSNTTERAKTIFTMLEKEGHEVKTFIVDRSYASMHECVNAVLPEDESQMPDGVVIVIPVSMGIRTWSGRGNNKIRINFAEEIKDYIDDERIPCVIRDKQTNKEVIAELHRN